MWKIYTLSNKRKIMKNKHIKMFEAFSSDKEIENSLIEKIYEEWKANYNPDFSLFEDEGAYQEPSTELDIFDDSETLTRGEKAAAAREFQIMTRPQLGVLYLAALGQNDENNKGKYLLGIPGMEGFGYLDPSSRSFEISVPAIADAIGLDSSRTAARTIKKFVLLINGQREATMEESIYPKLIKAFDDFASVNPKELQMRAAGIIQNPDEYTLNRDKAESEREMASERRAQKKNMEIQIGDKVYSLFKTLRGFKKPDGSQPFANPRKAFDRAIEKIASETSMRIEDVANAYRNYLKKQNILDQINYPA